MKSGIHPEVHADAKTTCSTCNAVYEISSTEKEQTVESCRQCNPIYTGEQRKEMKGGRVDRFRKRMAKSQEIAQK